MKSYEINVDADVFNSAYVPHLNNFTRTQIIYGGASSGKSWFIAERAVIDVARGGRNYLICRQVARTIKTSVFAQVVRIIREWGLLDIFTINKSDYVITCANGYQMIFVGLDDVEKIKSIVPAKGAWTDIWLEEATETDRASVKQLEKRQRGGDEDTKKRLILSFNPILKTHWIYEDYFKVIAWTDDQTEYHDDNLSILKTWYIHNRFLTPDDVRDLENETDPYYYSVYTLGNWGVLGSVIFKNWRVEDLSGMRDQFTNRRVGLDFGFSSDPAAVVLTHYDRMRKRIYVFDEIYQTGLTNDELAIEVSRLTGDMVTCDSAEPKSIQELNKYGVHAVGAKKGKDSVTFGIDWLKQQEIIIDAGCINMRNELSQYKWKEDAGGNALKVPVDKNNHLIDALRYAYENDMEGFSPRSVVAFAG